MVNTFFRPRPHRRSAIAATAALHLALLYCWQLAQKKPAGQDYGSREAIQWLWLKPKPAPQPERRPEKTRETTRRSAPPAAAAPMPADVPDELAEPIPQPDTPAATSAEALLQQGKRSAAGIYNELRKEKKGLIAAPPDSPQLRMQKKMAKAHELAPPRWYQAPKITEIQDPGGYGRKRYRVITARGTYCVTYESNHAPDGLDTMKNGIKPKFTNCPEHEDVATKQEWRDP